MEDKAVQIAVVDDESSFANKVKNDIEKFFQEQNSKSEMFL